MCKSNDVTYIVIDRLENMYSFSKQLFCSSIQFIIRLNIATIITQLMEGDLKRLSNNLDIISRDKLGQKLNWNKASKNKAKIDLI